MSGESATNWLAWVAATIAGAFAAVSLWTVRHLPNQDGPAHSWMVQAWSDYTPESVVADWASPNITLAPNWSATLVTRVLDNWLSPEAAQTSLVTLLVIAFVLAMGYALSAVRRRGFNLLVLAIPLSLHWYVFRGSFNFALGVVMLILTIGFWLRHANDPTPRSGVVLSVLLLGTYFSHPVPFVAALVVLAASTLALAWGTRRENTRGRVRVVFFPFLAIVPALALLAIFFGSTNGGVGNLSISLSNPIRSFLGQLSLLRLLEILDIAERPWALFVACAVLLAGGVALVTRIRSRRWVWTDSILVAGVILSVSAYIAPDSGLGGTSIPNRIVLCAVITCIIWAATIEIPPWAINTVIAIGLIASIGLTWSRLEPYQRFDTQFREITEAQNHVEPGSSILPVVLWDYLADPFHRVMPPLYVGSWIAQERNGIDLGNLDLGTDYHPLRWRADLNQDLFDWMARYGPGDITPSRTDSPPPEPGTIDYVLLVGPLDESDMDPDLASWLEREYEAIFESPSEVASLYRTMAQD